MITFTQGKLTLKCGLKLAVLKGVEYESTPDVPPSKMQSNHSRRLAYASNSVLANIRESVLISALKYTQQFLSLMVSKLQHQG